MNIGWSKKGYLQSILIFHIVHTRTVAFVFYYFRGNSFRNISLTAVSQ